MELSVSGECEWTESQRQTVLTEGNRMIGDLHVRYVSGCG